MKRTGWLLVLRSRLLRRVAVVVLLCGACAQKRGGEPVGFPSVETRRAEAPKPEAQKEPVAEAAAAASETAEEPKVETETAPARAEAETIPGETFSLFERDKDMFGWRFDHGGEFPGAKGGLTVDTVDKKDDKASLKLEGDFTGGDAAFADPVQGFPFTIENGILRIEARKDETQKDRWNRKWAAGLLSSNDPKGNGFSQQYGCFEMRAKLPGGAGVWPAFWLASTYDRTKPGAGEDGSIEIDVIEFYGHSPGAYQSAVHTWKPDPHSALGSTVTTRMNEVSTGFHNYGVMVEPDFITMYFDGVGVWKTPTPPEHNKPLMLLVNLALGSGWPIDRTPDPSCMYVEHVRAYAKKQT